MRGCSLAPLSECVLCSNGHRFCLECLGQWVWVYVADDDDDDIVDVILDDSLIHQSWLGRDESYSVFPFNRDTLIRDPARMLSVRHARLRHAATLPDIR